MIDCSIERRKNRAERQFQDFNLRLFTLRGIYKINDNPDNKKIAGPGHMIAWALKSGKYANGTDLQIIFNDYIPEKVFLTIFWDTHITPIF